MKTSFVSEREERLFRSASSSLDLLGPRRSFLSFFFVSLLSRISTFALSQRKRTGMSHKLKRIEYTRGSEDRRFWNHI